MKNLDDILLLISISDFNDMVMTYLSGDEDYIADSLHEGGEITHSPQNYMETLSEAGYTNDNFPWPQFRIYCSKVITHLQNNLILQLS